MMAALTGLTVMQQDNYFGPTPTPNHFIELQYG